MAPLDSPPEVRTVLIPAAAAIHAKTASLAIPDGSVPYNPQQDVAIHLHICQLYHCSAMHNPAATANNRRIAV